jgi:hypothetical protein
MGETYREAGLFGRYGSAQAQEGVVRSNGRPPLSITEQKKEGKVRLVI